MVRSRICSIFLHLFYATLGSSDLISPKTVPVVTRIRVGRVKPGVQDSAILSDPVAEVVRDVVIAIHRGAETYGLTQPFEDPLPWIGPVAGDIGRGRDDRASFQDKKPHCRTCGPP
jgi:hypothetical protein